MSEEKDAGNETKLFSTNVPFVTVADDIDARKGFADVAGIS